MPRIVLINDDGIHAPGIKALRRAAEGLGELLVVVPDRARSGSGHSVTTDEPIPVRLSREGWYAVGGTPVDCSRLALTHLAPGTGWVLSGINAGGNLGADTYISGTVAAAREAAFLGVPAIAFSQYLRDEFPADWEWSLRQTKRILSLLLSLPPRKEAFWNVNFPHLAPGAPEPEVVFCGLDLKPLDVRYRIEAPPQDSPGKGPMHARFAGIYHTRPRDPGRDVDVCFGGRIAVTEIPLDITG